MYFHISHIYKMIAVNVNAFFYISLCSYKMMAGPTVDQVTNSTGLTNGCMLRRRYLISWTDAELKVQII